ncbi:MAG TPA: metallophosphoesterase family protein [Acidobacteriota bacterium]|nr:metallophosphoesterase family protein [Acidobacteriota bacterium]
MLDNLSIFAASDIHERLDYLEQLAGTIEAAHWVLLLGDLTHFGHAAQAARVLDAFRRINPQVLAVPGNVDHPDVLDLLVSEGVSLHGSHRVLESQVGVAGMGASTPTPFGTPSELSEEELYRQLNAPLRAIGGCAVRLVISHTPPRDTRVDRVRLGFHAGSRSVRRLIEEHSPDLLLCGHIHEAAGEDTLGHTRVLNPGPFGRGGYVWAEVSTDGVAAECRCASSR